MKYRELGRTGWKVSTVSFGAWAIGGDWGAVDDKDSLAACQRAMDVGGNFIDAAEVYGEGRSAATVAHVRREHDVLARQLGLGDVRTVDHPHERHHRDADGHGGGEGEEDRGEDRFAPGARRGPRHRLGTDGDVRTAILVAAVGLQQPIPAEFPEEQDGDAHGTTPLAQPAVTRTAPSFHWLKSSTPKAVSLQRTLTRIVSPVTPSSVAMELPVPPGTVT